MSINPLAVYVLAPQGAGKSRNAAELAQLLGCTTVVDEWDGSSPVPDGALVLGQTEALAGRVLSLDVQANAVHVATAG